MAIEVYPVDLVLYESKLREGIHPFEDYILGNIYRFRSFLRGRLDNTPQENLEEATERLNKAEISVTEDYELEVELFFKAEEVTGIWARDWLNVASPEEAENHLAFFLGSGDINIEQYDILMDALRYSKVAYAGNMRRDGLRQTLEGHILPGLRFIFENREEYREDMTTTGEYNMFELIFTFLGHDWIEDNIDNPEFLNQLAARFGADLWSYIKCMTHDKKNGMSTRGYSEQIATSPRVVKVAKLIDRTLNLKDDLGKAVPFNHIPRRGNRGNRGISRIQEYIRETQEEILPIMARESIPCLDLFSETIKVLEADTSLNIDYLDSIRDDAKKLLGQQESHYPRDRFSHANEMIDFLHKNGSLIGVVNSAGFVGAILLHDLINDPNFKNWLGEEGIPKYKKMGLLPLLMYSVGVAISSKKVEAESELYDVQDLEAVYGPDSEWIDFQSLFPKRPDRDAWDAERQMDEYEYARRTGMRIFTPPRITAGLWPSTLTPPSMNLQEVKNFIGDVTSRINLMKGYYALRPTGVPFEKFMNAIQWDLEGIMLHAIEKIHNMSKPRTDDPTYLWRNAQECMYFIIPLLEATGIKGLSKMLSDIVDQSLLQYVLPNREYTELVEEYKRNVLVYQMITECVMNVFKTGGGILEGAVVRSDIKSLGSTLRKANEKRMQRKEAVEEGVSEEKTMNGREVPQGGIAEKYDINDLGRLRVHYPTMGQKELLEESLRTIRLVLETLPQEMSREGIFVDSISLRRTGGETKSIKVSLNEMSTDMIQEIASCFGIEENAKKEKRPTKYQDVKTVFQIALTNGERYFIEIQFVEESMHRENIFGSASRILRKLTKRKVDDQELNIDQQAKDVLKEVGDRALTYILFSTGGLFLSPEIVRVIEDEYSLPLGEINNSGTPLQIGMDFPTATVHGSILGRTLRYFF